MLSIRQYVTEAEPNKGVPADNASERLTKSLGRPFLQKPFDLKTLADTLDHAEDRAGT